MASAENCLIITGRLIRSDKVRYSPAGVAITRFTLEHRSRQIEAGIDREALCRIVVIACGEGLQGKVAKLVPGVTVTVRGFVSRANHRHGEKRLVLHAEHIELLS
jgi:primosomal replication protein N